MPIALTSAAVLVASVLAVVALPGRASAQAQTTNYTQTYSTPGDYTFVVPAGVTSIDATATGQSTGANGNGGGNASGEAASGSGLVVSPGQSLYVIVGGNGFGGGGAGFRAGGGASWLTSAATPTTSDSLLVGAGAGGAGICEGTGGSGGPIGGSGGNGGAGCSNEPGGLGGSQSAGGLGGGTGTSKGAAGSFGQGGAGVTGTFQGGGGGGGYYGGGGGSNAYGDSAGGGGGSSYASPAWASTSSAAATTGAQVIISYAASAPTATISSPTGIKTYTVGQVVPTAFACADPSGPGISTCTDSQGNGTTGASAASGTLDTSTIGAQTYTVTATSEDGLTAQTTLSYAVAASTTSTLVTGEGVGSDGGASICTGGQVAAGFEVYVSVPAKYLAGLATQCRNADNSISTQPAVTNPVGGVDDDGATTCPAGTVAIGYQAWSAYVMDGIGVRCIGSGNAIITEPIVRPDNGGSSQGDFDCPAGSPLIGAQLTNGIFANNSSAYTITGECGPQSVVTFGSQPNGIYGGSLMLNATATDGMPVTYSVPSSSASICKVSGSTLSYIGAGQCVVDAETPAGASSAAQQMITVLPAPLTVTASNASMTYGGSAPTITGGYSGLVNGDTAASLSTMPTCTTSATATSPVGGSYTSSCSGAVDPNYAFTYVNGSVSVGAATLTVTASSPSMTYGGAVPDITPSYSGFANGQDATVITTPPTCSTQATLQSSVGSYSSSCSGAQAGNYTFTYVGGSVAVDPAALTITASSPSMVYGGAVPHITASYSGFVNGDGASALATLPTCSTVAQPTSRVGGSYASSCSGAVDANYSISYANGAVQVTPAPLTITASSQTSSYGTAPVAVTASYSGLVDGDMGTATPPMCTTAVTKATSVGTYATTCSGAADPDYAISYVAGVDKVTPATILITASSASMIYGTTPPTITASYSGLLNGDTAAQALSTPPTCSTQATATSNVGSYQSSCMGAISRGNYVVTYTTGSVGITPAPISIAPATVSILASDFNGKVTYAATVTNTASKKAAAGVTVVFSATSLLGYASGCTAVTNANGVATCTNDNLLATALLLPPTYTVKGSGSNYLSATATGRIVLI